ncbi:hypothetical protein AB0936_03690 [Streptomyces cyaneofuscatus]|uniref:hypothetical protein n=1 Tax=Streptomyces cyaneofuscatus TaxID=66883 RepID=UPI000B2B20EF|nr:hypothetical protein [Streptomyces cyaneofuscatus]
MNPAHLVEMAARSVGHSEALMELALAWTVTTRPYVSGTRGLARWSGMGDQAVRHTVGAERELSEFKFLWTKTRGVSSPTAEERDSMEIRFRSNTGGRHRSTPPNYLSSPPGGLALKEGREELPEGNAVTTAAISERARKVLGRGLETLSTLDTLNGTKQTATVLRALDPSLDVWAEVHGEGPGFALGRRAWHLAILSGLEDVVLSSQDIAELLGVAQKSVRDLLARMAKVNCLLVHKVRQGRSFVYEIRWASVVRPDGEYWDDRFTRHQIRDQRAARDREVQATSARRGTPAGYLAHRLSSASPKRDAYLEANPLPADADGVWRALVEAGDEMALYEHLKAQEAEVGPVPSTPKVLVAQVAEADNLRRPAQESLETAVASKETLAEMRKRVIAWSR